MQAAIYERYGDADVIEMADRADPVAAKDEILVEVAAAGVTTADWRLRAAAFPGPIMQVIGRLMFGITGPRNPVLGSDFAGRVIATGAEVAGFKPGDRVFGFAPSGAHAERLTIRASGAVLPTPDGLSDVEAAALPFGALAALSFLERFAGVKPGEHVLIQGASGGVGAYAVQIAKALGARVTAVASGSRATLLRDLGADHVIDYRARALTPSDGPFDVVFDTVGVLDYDRAAPLLARGGRFVPLNFGLKDLRQMRRAKRNGHRIILQVNGDSKEGLSRIRAMFEAGQIRPVIDTVFPFTAIKDAYRLVETRHRQGAVILDLKQAESLRAVA